jgi:hypothetical protein
MGWFTVAAYFGAAYLALVAGRAAREAARAVATRNPGEAHLQGLLAQFWGLACLIMLVLGINKQLDLQSLLTEIGRDLAVTQGWYEQRRRYQLIFVLSVLAGGSVATLALAYVFRRVLRRLIGGILGLGVIVSFVVVRAASFHHIDMLLKGPLRLNWVLELTGIGLVGLAARRGALACRKVSGRS